MNIQNDSYDSAVMRVLVQPLLDEDLARFDEYNKIPHECSWNFNKKLNKLFTYEKIMSYGKVSLIWLKRVAVCAMVGIMFLLASCAAVKPLREKIVNAVVEWYSEYVAVYFEEIVSDPMMRNPQYIPEQYSLLQDNSLEDYRIIIYSDSEGNLITFMCKPNSETATLYDRERHNVETVKIDGVSGVYLYGDGESNILTWSEAGYIYSIVGYCEKNELLKMAESLK